MNKSKAGNFSFRKLNHFEAAVEVCRLLDRWHVKSIDDKNGEGSFEFLALKVVPKACGVVRFFDGKDSLGQTNG
jgi:hypothetical protein